MNLYKWIISIAAVSIATGTFAQTNYDLFKLNETGKLNVHNRQLSSVEEHGKKAVRFSEKEYDGVAWLDGVDFSNGTIELDIRGKDEFQKSFVGVAFHGSDDKSYDAVYFRPFNFHAADSVRRIHAVQYIAHPDFPWPKLRSEHNGKFEKAIPLAPDPNDWFHVKIVVDYPHVSVYVNNDSKPCLQIEKLNQRTSGKIGLWTGHQSGGDFTNLVVSNK